MKRKELLYISICVFMTILAWLVADLYHSASQKTIQAAIADPVLLQYKIDPNILQLIENRKQR